jgi:hypothetical protein
MWLCTLIRSSLETSFTWATLRSALPAAAALLEELELEACETLH